jgi:hypothetical protein
MKIKLCKTQAFSKSSSWVLKVTVLLKETHCWDAIKPAHQESPNWVFKWKGQVRPHLSLDLSVKWSLNLSPLADDLIVN